MSQQNSLVCAFLNIHYIICDCGSTFPTEEELKEHLQTEHSNGNVLETTSAPIKISKKKQKDEQRKFSLLNKKKVADKLQLLVVDDEQQCVEVLNAPIQPVYVLHDVTDKDTGTLGDTLSDGADDFKKRKEYQATVKREGDITYDTASRAMGFEYVCQANKREPMDILDPAVIGISEMTYEDAVAEMERRQGKRAPHRCQSCYRHFQTQEKLDKHMLLHDEVSGSFMCRICKLRFKKRSKLRFHVINKHTRKYSCKLCPFVTTYICIAEKHIAFHRGARHRCTYCPMEFAFRSTLKSHVRLKHPLRHPCDLCGYMFLSQFGVHLHKNRTHRFDAKSADEGPYCGVCDVKFATREAHDRHLTLSALHVDGVTLKNVKNTPQITNQKPLKPKKNSQKTAAVKHKGPVTCEQCGVELATPRHYVNHFESEHPGVAYTRIPAPRHMCHLCGKLFPRSTSLAAHMQVHGEKRFSCKVCDRRFACLGNLRVHARTHDAHRPRYPCPLCGLRFTVKHNLTRHIKLHQGIKPFQCDICGKKFSTKVEKKLHVDHVHLKVPRPPRPPRRSRGPRGPWDGNDVTPRQSRARIQRGDHDHEIKDPDHVDRGPDHEIKDPDHDGGPDHEKRRLTHDKNGLGYVIRGFGNKKVSLKRKGVSHMRGHDHADITGSDHTNDILAHRSHQRMPRRDHEIIGPDHEIRGPDHKKRGPDYKKRGPDHKMRGPDHKKTRRPHHIQIRGSYYVDSSYEGSSDIRHLDDIDMLGV